MVLEKGVIFHSRKVTLIKASDIKHEAFLRHLKAHRSMQICYLMLILGYTKRAMIMFFDNYKVCPVPLSVRIIGRSKIFVFTDLHLILKMVISE